MMGEAARELTVEFVPAGQVMYQDYGRERPGAQRTRHVGVDPIPVIAGDGYGLGYLSFVVGCVELIPHILPPCGVIGCTEFGGAGPASSPAMRDYQRRRFQSNAKPTWYSGHAIMPWKGDETMASDQLVQIAGLILMMCSLVIVLGTVAVWVYLLTRNTADGTTGAQSSQTDADAQ